MSYLCAQGFIVLIHDHRGHGESVIDKKDLGYFYDETSDFIVEDLHDVFNYVHSLYPDLPVYLFSHSMGTLVARKYLKKYDNTLSKLVLCGAPCANPLVDIAIGLAKLASSFSGGHNRNNLINNLVFGASDKMFKGERKNRWLSANDDNVIAYNEDPLCGFIFTNNGFLNLFRLLKDVFSPKGWLMQNGDLPILFIAGADDPVIGSLTKWQATQEDLIKHGYHNIQAIPYVGLRHEILNEKNKSQIYQDVLEFFK